MPLIQKQARLYRHAVRNEYIIPAFNCFDGDSAIAVLDAAEEENSPVILQICMAMHKKARPVEKFLRYCMDLADSYTVPILINHDHMQNVDDCKDAVDVGFPSIMFDGSQLPFEENIGKTREVVAHAHAKGVWVEAELGSIPGFEDMVFSAQSIHTEPGMAAEFIAKTGCDSLSVAVGTAHGGVRAERPLEIDFELLASIRRAVGETPLVLHGAASLPKSYIDEVNAYGGRVEYLQMCTEETIEKARHYGVAKANMDVDNFLKYTYTLRRFFTERPDQYDPYVYNHQACGEVKAACVHKMRNVTKSAGMGRLFSNDAEE